ncbi:MAG: helix-turn-helix domain-containing protein [Nitrososphaeria archaeon]
MNIYELKLKLYHDSCWSTITYDYNLNVQVNSVMYYPFESKLVATATINAENEKILNEFVNHFNKSYPSKRKVKYTVKFKKNGVYLIYFESEYDLSISSIIYETKVPYWKEKIINGNENWRVLVFGKNQLNVLLERVKQIAKIKNFEINMIDPFKLIPESVSIEILSEKEKEIILKAYELGYYDWPRGVDLDKLSKMFNISKVALLKNLRKGEKQIIKKIIDGN